jgi:hypothetical protein
MPSLSSIALYLVPRTSVGLVADAITKVQVMLAPPVAAVVCML